MGKKEWLMLSRRLLLTSLKTTLGNILRNDDFTQKWKVDTAYLFLLTETFYA